MQDASKLVPGHTGPKLISANTVRIIAVVDGDVIAPPACVDGLASAGAWLDHTYPDAAQAVFYKAERLADHPDLICGGVFGSCGELAFVKRKAAA